MYVNGFGAHASTFPTMRQLAQEFSIISHSILMSQVTKKFTNKDTKKASKQKI